MFREVIGMKKIINGWLTAFTVLSRIPVPFRFQPIYRHFGLYLPGIGFLAALPLWGASLLPGRLPMVILAVFGMALQYWLFVGTLYLIVKVALIASVFAVDAGALPAVAV
jgi:hypothetical protein